MTNVGNQNAPLWNPAPQPGSAECARLTEHTQYAGVCGTLEKAWAVRSQWKEVRLIVNHHRVCLFYCLYSFRWHLLKGFWPTISTFAPYRDSFVLTSKIWSRLRKPPNKLRWFVETMFLKFTELFGLRSFSHEKGWFTQIIKSQGLIFIAMHGCMKSFLKSCKCFFICTASYLWNKPSVFIHIPFRVLFRAFLLPRFYSAAFY